MSQNLLEFILLITILVVIFITIFRLYIQNIELKDRVFNLKKIAVALKEKSLLVTQKEQENQEYKKEIDRLKEVESNYNQLLGKYSKIQEQLELANAQIALNSTKLEESRYLEEKIKATKEALEEKEQLIKTLKEQMLNEFKNLSNELLEKKQESINKSSKEQLEQLLKPFDKELKEFKDIVNKINSQQSSSINMLRGELIQLKELNNNLSKEAKELANALKGDNKLQGNWGELILDRALEVSGLRKGVEYKREVELFDNDKKYRADVVIYLPENKHLIIDSKVSLKSYIEAIKDNSNAKEAKEKLVNSIKRHIDILSNKKYHLLDNIAAPEFTLMFIPIEGAFSMALEEDNTLLEYALLRGVSIVTPTTLFATLKSIATIWKLANHDKNMQLLAKEASSLHYKFALFIEEFNKIENRLTQAISSWESAKLKLNSGQGSLYSKIQKVGELSGKAKVKLPEITQKS